jgi:hypothetical protein
VEPARAFGYGFANVAPDPAPRSSCAMLVMKFGGTSLGIPANRARALEQKG